MPAQVHRWMWSCLWISISFFGFATPSESLFSLCSTILHRHQLQQVYTMANDEKDEGETEEFVDTVAPLRVKASFRTPTAIVPPPRKSIRKSSRQSMVRVESIDDYLRLQKMNSIRKYRQSWLDNSDHSIPPPPGDESPMVKANSKRASSTRRIASTQGAAHLAQSSDWVEFLDHVHDDTDDEGDYFMDEHDHDVRTPFYVPPYQRQRWGAKQVLPHINWGDLFFDLFFVALASNLGTLLISVMEDSRNTLRGIIYFVGTFGPLFNSWENKTKYEARYTVNDHVHQSFDVLRFFVVAFAVLHVKSLKLLADPKSIESFFISACLFLDSILSWIINLELYFFADGDRTAIKNNAKRKIIQNMFFDGLYFAATAISGVLYFSNVYDDDDVNEYHRQLAAAPTGDSHITLWKVGDLALTLCCASYGLRICSQVIIMHHHNHSRKTRDFQSNFVPNNIEYLIHRYGEWVMLMIGESVLALLIVDTTESEQYYAVTGLGIFTVTTLQILKYESEPHKPSRHALLRSTTSGLFYSLSIQLFSMTLISFGISFKIFLMAIFVEDGKTDYRRDLAGTTVISADSAGRLYCISLTLVLLSLELLHLSHSSLEQNFSLYFICSREKWPLVLSGICKVLMMAFVATLCLWQTDPVVLSVAGCLVICLFAVSRVLSSRLENAVKPVIHQQNRRSSDLKSLVETATELDTSPDHSSRVEETVYSA